MAIELESLPWIDIFVGAGAFAAGWFVERWKVKPRLEEAKEKRAAAEEEYEKAEGLRKELEQEKEELEVRLNEQEEAAKTSFDVASPFEVASIQDFLRFEDSQRATLHKTYSGLEFDRWMPHADIPYRCVVEVPGANVEDVTLDSETSSPETQIIVRPGIDHEERASAEAVLRVNGPVSSDTSPKQLAFTIPIIKGFCQTWEELTENFPNLNPMREHHVVQVPAPTGQIIVTVQFPEEYTEFLDWLAPEGTAVQGWTNLVDREQQKRTQERFELIDPRKEPGVERPKATMIIANPSPGYSYGVSWRPLREDALRGLGLLQE